MRHSTIHIENKDSSFSCPAAHKALSLLGHLRLSVAEYITSDQHDHPAWYHSFPTITFHVNMDLLLFLLPSGARVNTTAGF
ncbi:hypothetical protein CEXT_22961 [Caerostris extrusa]|uniref:Uncharacterized protein n=1 Tax=Caerostris extrusa TaxID=172846 RepID=A0AAV4VCL9_CAEEX|nr:hypothetical protein CEXT_22961 [Caerostris extrusa]